MYLSIKTTSNDLKVLKKISNIILNNNSSPCVHIIENVKSQYMWKDNLTTSIEGILEIKTTQKYKKQICDIIQKEHNYDIPEITCCCIEIIDDKYKEWFNQCIN